MPRAKNRLLLTLLCLVLAAGTGAAFWKVRECGFINYDDTEYITRNQIVQQGLTLEGVKWAFTATHVSNWHPVTWLSHMLDCELFGLNPAGHHLGNLFFHAANALLLFFLLVRLTGACWRSALAAALFAWHPLHVESVAWVSERKDVLSTCFLLLTLLAYVRYAELKSADPRRDDSLTAQKSCWYIFALVLFALGLMSKPMLVTTPFVLLLIDWWPLRRVQIPPLRSLRGVLFEKIPFFALSIASCLITIAVQTGRTTKPLAEWSIADRIANAIVSYGAYLRKTVWPADLAFFYPLIAPPAASQVLLSATVLGVATFLAIRFAARHPYGLFGWLWFAGTLVPVIGLVHVGEQSHADRYTYIPLIGVFIALAWMAGEWAARRPKLRQLVIVSCALALGSCALQTSIQTGFWKDNFTVMNRALSVTENNFLAHNNLGVALAGDNRFEEAIEHYREALRIKPAYARAHSNLGAALAILGRTDEAIEHYRLALRLRADDAEAHYNLGTALATQRKMDDAIHHLQAALTTNPSYLDARYNLGLALLLQGKHGEAIEELKDVLKFKPNDPSLHYHLGLALKYRGDAGTAAMHFDTALRLARESRNTELLQVLQKDRPAAAD